MAVAASMASLAVLAWTTGGVRLALGPLRVSATGASRLLFEAAVAWLVAEVVAGGTRPPRRTAWALAALLLTAVVDSAPRRVGDGAEYMAMAVNLSRARPPALSADEQTSRLREMRAMPGFGDASMDAPFTGPDGRRDLYHFWLYPLVVAPAARLASMVQAHVNHAFTLVNLLLLGGLSAYLFRQHAPGAVAILTAGPILWWVDKAHAEVFLFVTLAFSAVLIDRRPAIALLAAGLATAQNPAASPVLAALLAWTMWRGPRAGFPIGAAVTALALAAMPSLYYRWHLGIWSPLASTVAWEPPGLRAMATVLVDPNLGLLLHAPVLAGLALVGLRRQPPRGVWALAAAAGALLVVFATVGNVNHGGTPGMSRYGLWLLAASTPLVLSGADWCLAHRPRVWRIAAATSIVWSVFLFRPAWADRAGDSPNWLAARLWASWPAIDNPLPEVFAERVSGRVTGAIVPVATRGCEKILISGDGHDTWWPLPCTPRPAPAVCAQRGVLCYVNNGQFSPAPRQPAFRVEHRVDVAWTLGNAARFNALLARLGSDPHSLRTSDSGHRIKTTDDLEPLWVLEGATGTALWIMPATQPSGPHTVRIDITSPATLEVWDAGPLVAVGLPHTLDVGVHTVSVPPTTTSIVLVIDH